MPSYHRLFGHKNQTIALSAALLAMPVLTGDARDLLLAPSCLLGLWLSPDLDLIDPRGLPGKFLEMLGVVDDYKDFIPHRHKLSHTPVLGTAIRLLFLLPLAGLLWMVGSSLPLWAMARVFVGLSLADSLHVATDQAWTWWKKKTKPFRTIRGRGR